MQQNSITHKQIWAISGPMILANISTPLLGLVDTAVVGHLESEIYLGGVALGATIFSFLFWGFGFLRMVTTGLTAQSQSLSESASIFHHSAVLAIIISLLLLLLQGPLSWLAFQLIHASSVVTTEAQFYFDIRIWSAPASLLNYVLMGWLIGKEHAKSALVLAMVINLFNILLDLLFVNYFSMQTEGVALATTLSEYIGVVCGILMIRKSHVHFSLKSLLESFKQIGKNRTNLTLHFNFMLRTYCLLFSFAFFTQQGAKQGDITLAANMVLLNFITLMAYVLDAFANATEVYSGKACAQKNASLLKSTLLMTGSWALCIAILFSLFYAMIGTDIISLLTSIDDVKMTATSYLPWLIAAPLIGVWSYLLDGLFVGATLGKAMRNSMLIATCCFYLPAWYLLQPYNNHGLWAALLIFLGARALTQGIYLKHAYTRLIL